MTRRECCEDIRADEGAALTRFDCGTEVGDVQIDRWEIEGVFEIAQT
jgi:hypothetical protein